MRVSRQHRMLVTGPRAELLFGSDEVLVRAEHLVHLPGVAHALEPEVTYVHILFDRHEVVLADGAWSESFQPGDRTISRAGPGGAGRAVAAVPGTGRGRQLSGGAADAEAVRGEGADGGVRHNFLEEENCKFLA